MFVSLAFRREASCVLTLLVVGCRHHLLGAVHQRPAIPWRSEGTVGPHDCQGEETVSVLAAVLCCVASSLGCGSELPQRFSDKA